MLSLIMLGSMPNTHRDTHNLPKRKKPATIALAKNPIILPKDEGLSGQTLTSKRNL